MRFRRLRAPSDSFPSVNWAVYLHPLAMLGIVGLGLWVFREGLRLRRARMGQRAADRRAHTRIARPLVVLIALGYASGLASMIWLRREVPMASVHFWLASGAALGLVGAGALGLWLERRVSADVRALHLAAGSIGLLLALGAALAAFAILP